MGNASPTATNSFQLMEIRRILRGRFPNGIERLTWLALIAAFLGCGVVELVLLTRPG